MAQIEVVLEEKAILRFRPMAQAAGLFPTPRAEPSRSPGAADSLRAPPPNPQMVHVAE